MFQRDYLLRLIEQATQVIATKVFKLKQEEKYSEALAIVNDLYTRLSLPNSKLLDHMEEERIIEMLSHQGTPDMDQVCAAAKLLAEEGSLHDLQGHHENAMMKYRKALYLYLRSHEWEESGNAAAEIRSLLQTVKHEEMPVPTSIMALRFLADSGEYSQAEDCLFRALELTGSGELKAEGIRFYRQLLDQSDDKLVEGNLPRNEVEASLAELLEP